MTTKPIGDIAAHRLSSTQLSCEFADIVPLLDPTAAAAANPHQPPFHTAITRGAAASQRTGTDR